LKSTNRTNIVILVYVDDIILARDGIIEIACMINLLNNTFEIKNLGDFTYFLRLEVARNKTGIHLCQQKYTLDLLEDVGIMVCAPVVTPMNHTIKLSSITRDGFLNPSSYRRLI